MDIFSKLLNEVKIPNQQAAQDYVAKGHYKDESVLHRA